MTAKNNKNAMVEGNTEQPDNTAAARRRVFLTSSASVLLIVGALGFWWLGDRNSSTEDAYIQANIVSVAPQVSGPVVALMIQNNAFVEVDDVLFRIDREPFELDVSAARARYDQAAQTNNAYAKAIIAAEALVRQHQAALDNALQTFNRVKTLFADGSASKARLDGGQAVFLEAQAALEAAQANLQEARVHLGAAGADNAALRVAMAELKRAELDLARTQVTAPASGWASNMDLRVGQMVEQGVPLFAIIEQGEWWVDANFKETDLGDVKIGDRARIEVDMYPGVTLNGVVESLGFGSGATFSLLPPENATGNWVKVTQRFTVRVRILEPPRDRNKPLRVGASTTVTIVNGVD